MTVLATWRALGSESRYISLPETILFNALRHMRNSAAHAAAGRPEYADGSAEKASKNFRLYFLLTTWVGRMSRRSTAILDQIAEDDVSSSHRPTPKMLEDARHRNYAPRSLTSWLTGDPAPGYSALDKRCGNAERLLSSRP